MYPAFQNLETIVNGRDTDGAARGRAIEQLVHLLHTGDESDRKKAASLLPSANYADPTPDTCPCSGCTRQRRLSADRSPEPEFSQFGY